MPTYEYKCPMCQKVHTEIRSMTEPRKETQCSNCKVDYITVFGKPAVTFNGTGFYTTDKKRRD